MLRLTFILLSALDLLLTSSLLGALGSEAEANPMAASAYSVAGVLGVAAFKTFWVVVVVLIAGYIGRSSTKYETFVYVIACVATGLAVALGGLSHAYL